MPSNDVYTTGYPKSGNTWLGRLISDLLDSPLSNVEPVNPPMDTRFCQTGNGGYVVRKTHWHHHEWSGDGNVVFIQRDPRDVVVSAVFYRSLDATDKHIAGAIKWMGSPSKGQEEKYKILEEVGHYKLFVETWLADPRVLHTKYEILHSNPVAELQRINRMVQGRLRDPNDLQQIVKRQSFEKWAPEFSHSMRKGIAGDWKNYFTKELGEQITYHLGDFMLSQRYINDLDWWKSLP